MNNVFKTLVFRGDRSKVLGRYAIPLESPEEKNKFEWGGCGTPLIITSNASISSLEKLYPGLNFREVRLITVTIQEIKTNKA